MAKTDPLRCLLWAPDLVYNLPFPAGPDITGRSHSSKVCLHRDPPSPGPLLHTACVHCNLQPLPNTSCTALFLSLKASSPSHSSFCNSLSITPPPCECSLQISAEARGPHSVPRLLPQVAQCPTCFASSQSLSWGWPQFSLVCPQSGAVNHSVYTALQQQCCMKRKREGSPPCLTGDTHTRFQVCLKHPTPFLPGAGSSSMATDGVPENSRQVA